MTKLVKQPRTPVLGLTGGIAAGKSTIARLFVTAGAVLIDADKIAHELMAPGQPGALRVRQIFGDQYFATDGSLRRQELGEHVFHDQQALQTLNELMQQLIRQRIGEQLTMAQQAAPKLIVMEIPLLFEQHYQSLCDAVLVVDVAPAVQLARLQVRNQLTLAQAQERVAAQLDRATRLAGADFVVDTSGDEAALKANFAALWRSAKFQEFLN